MDDVFARLRRLAVQLRHDGYDDLALQLTDAVSTSATGTELLMRVRWVLRGDQLREAMVPPALAARVGAMLAEVESLLST
ncbi:hypothetical protein [Microbacterium trichothecenolyticum]|uniref:Uncharacterized protein n=1 Tax=Microbacterium trichothecenolyticum TaxID=69370 RepID=A0ABU0TVK4_MICTR|nr:hypothetical protein [Microbacterium trichothecenolyticum]MDQ1123697.1 hypothetical protein [Microbacterium trichothecenolyticum]